MRPIAKGWIMGKDAWTGKLRNTTCINEKAGNLAEKNNRKLQSGFWWI